MAAEKETPHAGLVNHYSVVLHTLCQSRQMLAGKKEDPFTVDPVTIKAVDDAIKAAAGAIVLNVELAKARSAS